MRRSPPHPPQQVRRFPVLATIEGGAWRRAEVHVLMVDMPVTIQTDGTDLVIRADHEPAQLDVLRAQVGGMLVEGLEPVSDTGRLLRRALDVVVSIQFKGSDGWGGHACPVCRGQEEHAEDCAVSDLLDDLYAAVLK